MARTEKIGKKYSILTQEVCWDKKDYESKLTAIIEQYYTQKPKLNINKKEFAKKLMEFFKKNKVEKVDGKIIGYLPLITESAKDMSEEGYKKYKKGLWYIPIPDLDTDSIPDTDEANMEINPIDGVLGSLSMFVGSVGLELPKSDSSDVIIIDDVDEKTEYLRKVVDNINKAKDNYTSLNEHLSQVSDKVKKLEDEAVKNSQLLNEAKENKAKVSELTTQTKVLSEQVSTLTKSVSTLKLDKEKLNSNLEETNRQLSDTKHKLQSTDINLKSTKAELAKKKEEMQVYTNTINIVNDPRIETLAKAATTIFNAYDRACNLIVEATRKKVPADQEDNYFYYTSRAIGKFAQGKSVCRDIDRWQKELAMIADCGMYPAKGFLAAKTQDNVTIENLSLFLYNEVMRNLVSATLILCDEFSVFIPFVINGINMDKGFEECVSAILEASKRLGYTVDYVKPLGMLTPTIRNEEFAPENANLRPNQIFDVRKIGVSFSNTKDTTVVSAAK